MGIYKSYKRHFQLKECNRIRLEKQQRNNSIKEIMEHLTKMDEAQLQSVLNIITRKSKHQQANLNNLFSTIEQLSDTTFANEYIDQTLYKRQVTNQELQESNTKLEIDCKRLHQQNKTLIRKTQSLGVQNMHLRHQNANHISKIRSLARQSRQITNTTFKKQLKNIFKTNKREYSSITIWLATNISQVSQISLNSTAECMRLIYEFLIVDESARGKTKNFVLCYQYWNHKEQAPVVTMAHLEDIPNYNTSYMFETLFDDLELGIKNALESFQKWFSQWLHLPLAICRLGGNNAQLFASSFYHVILEKPWISPPSELELRFAQNLEDDKNNGITNDFGLSELLRHNDNLLEEFIQFCICNDPKLYLFPNLYDFVKSKIYYIVIHQQQLYRNVSIVKSL
ncbi:hypothetical protein RhiirB3_446735 [Rhizophagus irregularis]|nr:hypothetical protein RhiirB3_446735 [Rhizophagus irregularis]